MTSRTATKEDAAELTRIFWAGISADPSYISHGEIQMGIADSTGMLSADGREKWKKYISAKIAGPESRVILAEDDGRIIGFVVAGIESDGDKPYGVLYDEVVDPEVRSRGTGTALLKQALSWLEQQGVTDFYLESGANNHNAHRFFERNGFHMVSHIFRRSIK